MLKPEWRFLSYAVGGKCSITAWLSDLSSRVDAAFQVRLDLLKVTLLWNRKHCVPLKGRKLEGLWEIRFKADDVQHRVIGFQRANREFVMLIGCRHKQNVYDPHSALTTAVDRMNAVNEGKAEVRDYESECS